MGEVINNDYTKGTSGRTGDTFVYRYRKGRTFIAKRPVSRDKTYSEEQLETQARFSDAITYAKTALTDPVIKQIYAGKVKGLQSAYNVAMANFYEIPQVKQIDLDQYDGSIGSRILVKAVDKCKVTKVTVVIKTSAGVTLEQGDAVAQADGLNWLYTTTTLNSTPAGCTVTAIAYNLPGNNGNANKLV